MDPNRVRRLGVLGGTFDPIHIGHLIAASEIHHAWDLDLVLFVPTGQPWQKSLYSQAEDRFMMTALGVASDPRFAASRMEIDRRGETYTADTMDELRSFLGEDARLYFIAGADAALKLATWKHLDRLADLAEVIAVSRPGIELEVLDPQPGWPRVHSARVPSVDVSATDVRRRVAEGRPIDHLVPAPVVRYIYDRGLYVGEGEVADAS